MPIRRCLVLILGVVIIHYIHGSGGEEIDWIPIPDEFIHITIPRRLSKDFTLAAGAEHSDDFFYDEYFGDIPDGFLFDFFYLTTRQRSHVYILWGQLDAS